MATPQSILRSVFGYSEFRSLQEPVITNLLAQRDTLVIMPTGGGKSLCYQVPALLFDGLTVVVSPLIALMQDQVRQLHAQGVKAATLNSMVMRDDYDAIVGQVVRNELDLLYLAPETLFTDRILTLLGQQKVSCLAIDEAHCISSWGHDFRPEYRRLVEVRQRFPNAVCVALTATATPRVREDIQTQLGFSQGATFVASFDRPNLMLDVQPKQSSTRQVTQFLAQHKDQAGIIYCFSRAQVDTLAKTLQDQGYAALPYHAGLTDDVRRTNQERFIRDDVQIMVATVAFGMGINKPDIRWVIHHDLPKNIESYYQQVGRAGRDGLPATCVLLFSYSDSAKQRHFISQKPDPHEQQVAEAQLRQLLRFAESGDCRRKPLLAYLGETYDADNCGQCDNCTGTKPKEDVTVAAQKFLSCVYRTGQRFGAGYVIDVLLGSKQQKVLQNQHDQLSTYGIGKDYARNQWQHLANQFQQQGLLERNEFGGIALTDKAMQVLKSGLKVEARMDIAPAAKQAKGIDMNYDEDLFQDLRQYRKQIADGLKVPPYVIFSDKSLAEMATLYPQSEAGLLSINGVGQKKLESFGADFIQRIRDYCEPRNLADKTTARQQRQASAPAHSPQKKRFEVVGEAFKNGQTLPELVAEYQIKESTAIGYLVKYLQAGGDYPLAMVETLCTLPEVIQQVVFDAFDVEGSERLGPIFQALNSEVSYEDLHRLRLIYVCRQMDSLSTRNVP